MAGVVFKNITKQLSTGAMKGLNLAVDDGEFVTLAGEAESGSRELIKMAAGQSRHYEGMITVNEHRMTLLERRDNGACLITSQPIFGTPRRLIRAALTVEGARETDASIKRAAETAGITDILDKSVRRLSNVERLKSGLAVAIAMRAKVALMCEPLAGLSAREAGLLGIWLREMHARTGMTFLAAVQDPVAALSISTRVVVMREGAIIQSDTPQNIYDFPADAYVARYFGSAPMNMIPARLVSDAGEVYAEFGDSRVLIPAGRVSRLVDRKYVGSEIILGARPENIHYEGSFISVSPESVISLHIKQVELLGEITYLHARLEGLDIDVMARVDPRCIAMPGDELSVALDSNRLQFFDIETGASIMSRV